MRPSRASYVLAILTAIAPSGGALAASLLDAGGGLSWLVAAGLGASLGGLWLARFDRHFLTLVGGVASGMVLPILVLGVAADPLRLLTGMAPSVAIDAAAEVEADVISIPDGEARADLVGQALPDPSARRALPRTFYAAPVVPAGWTRDTPVAVWLRCEGSGERPRASCDPIFATRPVTGSVSREPPEGDAAVSDALRAHGLRAPSTVTVVRTSAAPVLDAVVSLSTISLAVSVMTLLLVGFVYARRRLSIRTGPSWSD